MYRLWKLKRRRRAEVAKGNCGLCYQPRGRLKFLCDKCAAKHRERQQARKADRTKVVVSEWRRRHLVGLLAFLTHKRGLKEQSS